MDISSLNLDELYVLADKVKSEIKSREVLEISKAKEQILSIASAIGMTVDAILKGATKPAKIKQVVAVKYRHPQNPTQQWTGRGRQPKWVTEWTESGKPIADLAAK